MVLIQKLNFADFQNYREEFKKCLLLNNDNVKIKKILIFLDLNIDDLPKFSKVQYIVKRGLSSKEIIEFSKKISKEDKFIYSTPFHIFGFELKQNEHNKNLIQTDKYTIFHRDSKIDTVSFNTNPDKSLFKVILPKIEEECVIPVTRKKGELVITNSKKIDNNRLNVVIVSVNYNDFLLTSLSKNYQQFENITIVTSSEDLMCQKICEKFNVNCVVTDIMYEDGAKFNKGKAINAGINSLVDASWILLLDADIIVEGTIDTTLLDGKTLYTADRYLCEEYSRLKSYQSGEIEISSIGQFEPNRGLGFFQLFHYSKENKYPETSVDAAWSDLMFRDKFTSRKKIENSVIHLGRAYTNWEGRKTERFLTDGEFQNLLPKTFDINKYFDKIYCLNLDRRGDRWENVKLYFEKNQIEVQRFSAVDGGIHSKKDNIQNLSDRGIIENLNALACLKSHLSIIKDAKLKEYEKILIFEDDVILCDDFLKKIKLVEKLDWKLLYLGASQFDWTDIQTNDFFYNCKKTLGTFAYAINSSIYDELISLFEQDSKSVDNYLSIIQGKYPESSFVFFPNIVISDVEDSDIRESKNALDYSKRMRWNTKNFTTPSVIRRRDDISIIIPCYGHSEYLKECVNSCLNQTIKAKNIIILLMDDESIKMRKEIESKSESIKCIASEKMNLSSARNRCIEHVDTTYFIPLDADDKLPNNFIEETSKYDSDVVYVGSKYFGSKTGTWPDPITEEINWDNLTTFRRNSLVCTALIKTSSMKKSGGYNCDIWAFEDMDLWIRMNKNNFLFKKCNGTFLWYRKHNNSSLLSKANSDTENIKSLRKIIMNDSFYKKSPKIIHWVWLGDKPFPMDIVNSWKTILPEDEWEYKLWNEDNIDINSSKFLSESYRLKKYGICVDYIRAKVLYEFGGVWLDTDCVINRDVSPFLQYDFFGSWENENYVNIGLIGCSPNLPIMKNMLDYYTNIEISESVIESQLEFVNKIGTGPMVLTNELLKIKNIRNGGFRESFIENEKKYLIETPDVFVLDDSENGRINYAVHLFDGSWTDKKEEWFEVVRKSYNNWKIKNNIL